MLNGLDLSNWQRSTPSLTGMSFLSGKATRSTGPAGRPEWRRT
jgi:hypothetical protein